MSKVPLKELFDQNRTARSLPRRIHGMDIHVATHSPVSTSEGYSVNENRIFVVVLIPSLPVFTDTHVRCPCEGRAHPMEAAGRGGCRGLGGAAVLPAPLSLCRNAAGNWVRAAGPGGIGIACGAGSLRSRRHSRGTVTSFCILIRGIAPRTARVFVRNIAVYEPGCA